MFIPIFIPISHDDESHLSAKGYLAVAIITIIISTIIVVGVCFGPDIVHKIRYPHGKVIATETVTDVSGEHSVTFSIVEK